MNRLFLCLAVLVNIVPCAQAADPLTFLKGRLGKRLAGGECTDLVCEALRIWGKDFFVHDPDKNGDYVWGTLVKKISHGKGWRDSAPQARLQPGDVIQYRDATLASGTCSHHSAMIAAVNQQGYATHIFEQNFGAAKNPRTRTVQRNAIDLTSLTKGTLWIYRPKKRQDTPDRWNFVVVNNAGPGQTVLEFLDNRQIGSLSLNKTNTTSSYKFAWVFGKGVPTLRLNGSSVRIANAGCYEVFRNDKGGVGVRMLIP